MYHALPYYKAMDLHISIFEGVAKFGYIGVDIFFVISGFVMALTSVKKVQSPQSSWLFIKKRFLRIYLGYWPIFILTLLYFNAIDSDLLLNKNLLQSFFLVNANMFDLLIAPAWSLSYELYFYVIVAVLLFSKKIKPFTVFGLTLILVVFKYFVLDLGANRVMDFFFTTLLFEFISGYLLFYFSQSLSKTSFLWLAIVLAVVALAFGVYFNQGYGFTRVLTFGVFAFSLLWIFIILEKNKIFIVIGIFKKIGDSSYTLYLSHTILLYAFYKSGLESYFVHHNMALIGFIGVVIFIMLISYVFYRLVELPLYRLIRNKLCS
jgi:peptidoglycan/LPS O-acetylase OafA/YrhL